MIHVWKLGRLGARACPLVHNIGDLVETGGHDSNLHKKEDQIPLDRFHFAINDPGLP